jgi:prepilin-type N-terminal cleavage/methylation domain-containing protein
VNKIRASNRGFTLVELMIVLVLLAIVASLAIPNMRRGMLSSKMRVTTRELVADFDYARSIAKAKCVKPDAPVNQQVRVVLTGSSNNVKGYQVLDNAGKVLRNKEFESGIFADFSGLTSSPVVYQASGSMKGVSIGKILVKASGVSTVYEINVNGATGLIRVKGQ